MARPKLKAECIRLRVNERRSLREIHELTGAPKGTLSGWLKDYPLTKEELAERRRTQQRYKTPKKDRGVESEIHRMMRGRSLTKIQKAKVSEAAAMLRMCAFGFNVFGSVFDGDKTDWLVETPDNKTHKIQVKTATVGNHSLPIVGLRCSSGRRSTGVRSRYKEGDFDFLVGYDLWTDTCYVWSWDDVAHLKASVTICPEAAERWDKLYGE